MKRGTAVVVASLLVGLAVLFPLGAFAGGELADDDDDRPEGDKTKGPYGFVKDTRGAVIAEATVTVDVKNRGQVVTQTNLLGAYRIPTFGIEIKPDDVTIGCKKEGFKQVQVLERLGMGDPKDGFEVECVMQKQ